MVTDPIGDLLIQIKNATQANKRTVDVPYSKMKERVAKILVEEGYLRSVSQKGELPMAHLHIELAYEGKTPVVTNLKRVSRPGMRWYIRGKQIPLVMGGMGISIVSTPQGVMTGKAAKAKGIGGELLCEVW